MRKPAEKKPIESCLSQTYSNSWHFFPYNMLTSHRTLLKMMLEEAPLKDQTESRSATSQTKPPSLNQPDIPRWEMGTEGGGWGLGSSHPSRASSAPRAPGTTKWVCGHFPYLSSALVCPTEATKTIVTVLKGLHSYSTRNEWPFHIILQSGKPAHGGDNSQR